MGKAIRIAGVAMALAVCAASASSTSYRESYTDTNLGGGNFLVTVGVNDKTSFATARRYALQRASEVCGAAGFQLLGADANSYGPTSATTVYGKIGNTPTATTFTSGGGHDVSVMYRCNAPPIHQPGGGGAGDLPRY
jgi:hypothetical protein